MDTDTESSVATNDEDGFTIGKHGAREAARRIVASKFKEHQRMNLLMGFKAGARRVLKRQIGGRPLQVVGGNHCVWHGALCPSPVQGGALLVRSAAAPPRKARTG